MVLTCKLVKTYCLPRLSHGRDSWPIETVDKHELDVSLIWNNGFRYVFNCCWRENVKPLQFFCQSMPLSYLIEERQLMFLVSYNVGPTDNIELQTLLHVKGKGKVFPYSLPSVGPGADPGVQAVSPQVT